MGAFVKLTHTTSNAEIVYVAEANNKKQYVFELDMSEAAQDFNGKSGKYSLTVIIGDAVISNPTAWVAAELEINLPEEDKAKQPGAFEPKPEILHVFREPEARPATAVSNAFALLCLAPILIMFVTVKYLSGISLVTFLCGNSLLA